MNHAQIAGQCFKQGYNCSQALVCAFNDVTGFDPEQAARLASSFGGGMGRMREVCGAVSGALLVLGITLGYSDPEDDRAKTAHYHLVQEFARRFREQHGSIICRDLLAGVPVTPGTDPQPRSEAFYRERPCLKLIRSSAGILEKMLEERNTGVRGERFKESAFAGREEDV